MASAAAPENQGTDRKEEAAALALLLLSAKRRYSLPDLIRQQGVKPRPFRQIRPTLALKYDMAAPHTAIVKAWAAEIPRILDAMPLGNAAVAQAIDQAAARVAITVSAAKAQFPRILSNVERYHRTQWLSRVRASTGLDVSMLTSPQDVADPVAATTSWNQALADDVHHDTKAKLTALLLAGASAVDAKARADEVIAKARKRAANIGADQVSKAIGGMSRDRREAAGVTSYVWNHSAHVVHPRPHHVARNGQTFRNDEIAADDRCGVPFGCQCWESPAL